MFILAKPLSFHESLAPYLYSKSGSTIVKQLVWYGLAPDTRKGYAAAINSYKSFCALFNEKSWPALTTMLEEWVANRIFGSTLLNKAKQSSIQWPATCRHSTCTTSIAGWVLKASLTLIIKGGKRLFPGKKTNRLPITKDILEETTKEGP